MFKKSTAPAAAAGGYTIVKSLRFRRSASATLTRTPGSSSNLQKWTWSGWVKRGSLTLEVGLFGAGLNADPTQNYTILEFQANGTILVNGVVSGAQQFALITNAVYRDPAAWYHVIWSVDTTQATSSNRMALYVNGVLQTLSTASYPAQNANTYVNSTNVNVIGDIFNAGSPYFDGYMAEINFVDGQQLTPTSFGSFSGTGGVWQPIAYTGTYGTNGYYLKFTNTTSTATLGNDSSGNGNTWTVNNISLTAGATYDSMTDVPTLTSATVANYSVINPLNTQSNLAVTNGNLQVTNSTSNWRSTVGTFGATSGKWYWEVSPNSGANFLIGFAKSSFSGLPDNQYSGTTTDSYGYGDGGSVFNNGSGTAYGNTFTNGDIIGVALDLDNGKAYFSKNGTWQNSGDPVTQTNPAFTSLSGTILPAAGVYGVAGFAFNFGQRAFAYTPPTGFVALNTYNLPTPTIAAGNKYMDATLYTGAGGNSSITNAGLFKPDLTWIKGRSNTGSHVLQDSVRGAGSSTKLSSNSTNAENNAAADATDPIYGYISAFNSNGFSVVDGTTPAQTNKSGITYVGWQWQAGQSSGSTNTNGSITSTVSVNTTAGFSIIKYVGNGSTGTIGHGLGVAPKLVIVRRYNAILDWITWHTSIPITQSLLLNATDAATTSTDYFNSTAPTSTVISLGVNNGINGTAYNNICYAWAEIAGFSAFGSYTGNASTDGPFVYTGFRPKFVLIKNASAVAYWVIFDTTRGTYNIVGPELYPNVSDLEDTSDRLDILSNGFKIRVTSAFVNGSGNTLIYAAFAENPFKYALAR
jgi:hypothetical protein